MARSSLLGPLVMVAAGAAIAAGVVVEPELGRVLALGLGGFLVGFGLILALMRAGVVRA